MYFTFEPFVRNYNNRNMTRYNLTKKGLSAETVNRLFHDQNITIKNIVRVCEIMGCGINDVVEVRR